MRKDYVKSKGLGFNSYKDTYLLYLLYALRQGKPQIHSTVFSTPAMRKAFCKASENPLLLQSVLNKYIH